MDEQLIRFREAADRENRGRRALRRRYSPVLQEQAVAYWQTRRAAGEGFRTVATALGVAPWSLHRWVHRSRPRASFRPIEVVAPEPPRGSGLVVTLTTDGARVEGLDLDTAVRLLRLLR